MSASVSVAVPTAGLAILLVVAALVGVVCSSNSSSTITTVDGRFELVMYPTQPDFGHQTGFAVGSAWATNVSERAQAFLTYGPYLTNYPANTPMAVDFTLSVDNNQFDALRLVVLSVTTNTGNTVLTQTNVIRTDFESVAPASQVFTLFFVTPATPSILPLEFRVFYACCSAIVHYQTVLRQLLDPGPPGMLWNDTRHLGFVSKHQFPTTNSSPSTAGMNVGFYFVPSTTGDGILWLFHREYFFDVPQPTYCKADYARILVRWSSDGGVTFSEDYSVVATPVEGTPYECAIVDGAAHYDAASNTWVYLGQCLARDEVWNLCLFTLTGSVSPVGPLFTPSPSNPVVRSGQLWSQICSSTRPSHCNAQNMGSEGTPDIPYRDATGYYYVTFHGWDPVEVKSARGVAKTLDFVHWVTNGANLPGDAMFTSVDCNTWSGVQWAAGGCVGGGEGTILVSNDFMYQLIEAPDITLLCLTSPGVQNWVLGLSRAPAGAFLATGQWEQYTVSPIVVPVIKQGCFIQYHRIFVYNESLFLTFWADNWLQMWSLTESGPFAALPIVAGNPP